MRLLGKFTGDSYQFGLCLIRGSIDVEMQVTVYHIAARNINRVAPSIGRLVQDQHSRMAKPTTPVHRLSHHEDVPAWHPCRIIPTSSAHRFTSLGRGRLRSTLTTAAAPALTGTKPGATYPDPRNRQASPFVNDQLALGIGRECQHGPHVYRSRR